MRLSGTSSGGPLGPPIGFDAWTPMTAGLTEAGGHGFGRHRGRRSGDSDILGGSGVIPLAITPEDVDRLLAARSEDEHLEFKQAANHYDFEKLVDYCAALANEGGGQIVLGVTDKPPRRVVGTGAFEVPQRTVAGIYERIGLKVTCEEVQHPGGRVLVFRVPSRPLGQAVRHRGRYWMRAGEQLVQMPFDEIKRIASEGASDWTQGAAMTTVDSHTVTQLLDTQRYFLLLGSSYPTTQRAVLNRFAKEKLVQPDNGSWTITNLGAILFARNLEDFDLLRRKSPRVTVYEGKKKLRSRHDQLMTKGYATGFDELVSFVTGLIPHNEVIERALRRDVKMFPEIAVRELIANALIHQDFELRGMSVDIEIFDDRMEISSPGTPSISPERFIDEYESRNERLANLMRRLGVCEEKGTGVDKVVSTIEEYQLPPPDFRESENRTTVVLFSHKEFGEMDGRDRIRAAYQHCCLRFVQNERMTNQSLRDRFKLPRNRSATVSQVIMATVKSKKIKRGDPSQTSLRYRHYVPFWA